MIKTRVKLFSTYTAEILIYFFDDEGFINRRQSNFKKTNWIYDLPVYRSRIKGEINDLKKWLRKI
jgi:hypothetical protein